MKIDGYVLAGDPAYLPASIRSYYTRSTAIKLAAEGADWIIQLDSDEVVPDVDTFVRMIHSAGSPSADALDFPSRWIYARIGGRRALECCTRWWRVAAGYPGPLAVRPTVALQHARQCEERTSE